MLNERAWKRRALKISRYLDRKTNKNKNCSAEWKRERSQTNNLLYKANIANIHTVRVQKVRIIGNIYTEIDVWIIDSNVSDFTFLQRNGLYPFFFVKKTLHPCRDMGWKKFISCSGWRQKYKCDYTQSILSGYDKWNLNNFLISDDKVRSFRERRYQIKYSLIAV